MFVILIYAHNVMDPIVVPAKMVTVKNGYGYGIMPSANTLLFIIVKPAISTNVSNAQTALINALNAQKDIKLYSFKLIIDVPP